MRKGIKKWHSKNAKLIRLQESSLLLINETRKLLKENELYQKFIQDCYYHDEKIKGDNNLLRLVPLMRNIIGAKVDIFSNGTVVIEAPTKFVFKKQNDRRERHRDAIESHLSNGCNFRY